MLTSGAATFVAALADWGSSHPASSGAKAARTNAMQADLRNGCAGGLDFKTGPQVWIAVWMDSEQWIRPSDRSALGGRILGHCCSAMHAAAAQCHTRCYRAD